MTRSEVVRERHVWIAVTAVLATSLAWLSTLIFLLAALVCKQKNWDFVAGVALALMALKPSLWWLAGIDFAVHAGIDRAKVLATDGLRLENWIRNS